MGAIKFFAYLGSSNCDQINTLRTFLQFCLFYGMVILPFFDPAAAFAGEFSPHRTDFRLQVQNREISYKIMSVFVMPEETVKLHIKSEGTNTPTYSIRSSHSRIQHVEKNRWKWYAPGKPGHYMINVFDDRTSDSMLLNIFVMVPRSHQQGEHLNGYRVGRYPHIPLKGLSIYKPPHGFIEVTADNADTMLSPHFRLKQFLCKQDGEYPKYMVLKEDLLLKLELILQRVNAEGYRCDSFHVMSGYRTPYYNKAIGNVKYSRHIYGGAADIYIDENPKDEMMDDLNRDGRIDYKDADVVYEIVDALYGKPFYERFVGGLARYRKTSNHGPFVHIDVRGRRARWGD
jgi:hypothetical protein